MPQHPHPSSIRIPADLKKFLLRKAAEEDRKLGGMIIHILEEYRAAVSRRKVEKVEQ